MVDAATVVMVDVVMDEARTTPVRAMHQSRGLCSALGTTCSTMDTRQLQIR